MYKLIQDDCLNVMKMMPDGSVDLVLTDPPYGKRQTREQRELKMLKTLLLKQI